MKYKLLKDWLSLSKSEQRAGTAICVIFILLLSVRIYHALSFEEVIEKELILAKDIVAEEVCLYPFDPNNISFDSLKLLGFSDKLAYTYIKYQNNYGPIKSSEQFCKVYGMSPELCKSLLPYAQFPAYAEKKPKAARPRYDKKREWPKKEFKKQTEYEILELNTADSVDLINLKGIGPVFAKRILKYRDILGGYYSKEQLREVYGLDSARYEALKDMLTVNPSLILQLPIAQISLFELKKHPYFSSSLARAIVRYRDQHQEMKSIEELKEMHLLTDSTFNKIRPYLSLNDLHNNIQ